MKKDGGADTGGDERRERDRQARETQKYMDGVLENENKVE